MKIVLLHGDNTPKVHDRAKTIINGVQKKGWKVEHVEKSTDLAQLFLSTSLFPETKLVVVDGVGSLTTKNIKFLSDNADKIDGSLLVVHNGLAPKASLKPISKLISEETFEVPKIIFKYLESLYPGNAKNAITMLHQLLETEPKELVFTLMASYVRDLLWAKADVESLPYPDWRKKKLISQAGKFSEKQINDFVEKLATADIESKTGGIDLQTSLDIILVKVLS